MDFNLVLETPSGYSLYVARKPCGDSHITYMIAKKPNIYGDTFIVYRVVCGGEPKKMRNPYTSLDAAIQKCYEDVEKISCE